MNILRTSCRPLGLCLLLSTALPVRADVRLPSYFTDHMLLQRDQPIRVWGWADPGEGVTATLSGKSATATTGDDGQWSVELPALASGEALELTVAGKNSVTLTDLIMGDVWVCSGQSNMEMTLGGCLGDASDIQAADLPKIRRIKFNHEQAGEPGINAPTATPWQVCSPQTVPGFTAAGFYFAREVQAKTGVPIGIVDSNWGGTRIEPWIPLEGMAMTPALQEAHTARLAEIAAYRNQLRDALTATEAWIGRARQNLDNGRPVLPAPRLPDGVGGWNGMYNAMIHPIVKAPVKGFLWYQGESNGEEGQSYADKMAALIGGWRQQWGQPDLPFYFVQLAPFLDAVDDPAGGNGWARLREAQLNTLAIPHTGMAVITDTVPYDQRGDIHPRNKYDVGMRLAQWALAKDYAREVVASGPLFAGLKMEGDKARVDFTFAGTGLMVGKKEGRSPATEDAGGKLMRFSVAGADKVWHHAEAVIDGQSVLVSSPEVKEPVAVRYGFEMNPAGANLYNRAGLPASPFRSDTW